MNPDDSFAFPISYRDGGCNNGMSMREWFAGQALVGMCTNPDFLEWDAQKIATAAFDQADAMILASKEPTR